MFFVLKMIGAILLFFPVAVYLAVYGAATVDFLIGGGKAATTTSSNDELQLSMHRIRKQGQMQSQDPLSFP